jgi:hypothetical protein
VEATKNLRVHWSYKANVNLAKGQEDITEMYGSHVVRQSSGMWDYHLPTNNSLGDGQPALKGL